MVAESADGWNTFFSPLDAYRHKLDVLARHCKDAGRDPRDIRKSLVVQAVIGETEADVAQAVDRMGGGDVAALRQRMMVGTPEQCAAQLLDYVRLGVGDFIIGARPPANVPALELIAKQVAPIVREEGAAILAAA